MHKLFLFTLAAVFSINANAKLWGSLPPPQFGPMPSTNYDRVISFDSTSGDQSENFMYFRYGRVYMFDKKGNSYGSPGGYAIADVQAVAKKFLTTENRRFLRRRLSWSAQGVLYGFLVGGGMGFGLEVLGAFIQPLTATPYGFLIDLTNPTEKIGFLGDISAAIGLGIGYFESGKARATARKVDLTLNTLNEDGKKEKKVWLTDASADDLFEEIVGVLDQQCQLELFPEPPPAKKWYQFYR